MNTWIWKKHLTKTTVPQIHLHSAWAMLVPVAALGVQAALWRFLHPYVWFLFYPAVFFSSWLGGRKWGIAATTLSAALVWWGFMPPQYAVKVIDPSGLLSIVVFLVMGTLFSLFQERLRQAKADAEAALDKVRELDDLKSRMFANVSHELRTPLALILGPSEQMLASETLTPESRRHLEVIDRNARLLYRHVTDLLDVARLESGRLQPAFARINLVQVARTVASHFDSLGMDRNIEFSCHLPETLPMEADPGMIQRVLLNLLSNAFKFTPPGGRIQLVVCLLESAVRIEVHDTGPGIPESHRERIFKRFEQVDGGAERVYGGTGLGLSIVKEFALLHRGTASVRSAPGTGSIFEVTIPLTAPAGTVVKADLPSPDPQLERQFAEELGRNSTSPKSGDLRGDLPLVLVVEDNADLGAYLVDLLKPTYRVELATAGHEGLEKALALRPALILTDIMMPGMSGDRMLQLLRAHPELDVTPVIVLTAKQDETLLLHLFELGAQDCVHKPFSNNELLARVRAQLTERKRSDASAHFQKTLYEAVAASIPQGGLYVVDPVFVFLVAQGSLMQDLIGFSGNLVGRSVDDVLEWDQAAMVKAKFQKALSGEAVSYEIDIRDRTLWTQYMPIRDASGAIVAAMALSLDVTARRRAELNLLGSETRYFGIFQNMMAGFARCRVIEENDEISDFEYLEVNPAFERLTGLGGVVGKRVSEIIPGIRDSNPELFQTYGRVSRTAVPERFETYVEPLGIWFSVTVYCPALGEFIAIFDNITEQKKSELALREATRRLELATRSAGLGVWDWDLRTNHMVWDDRMFDLYGYTSSDWPGGVEAWQQRLHPDDLARAMRDSQAALDGKSAYQSEFRIVWPDGSIHHLVADAVVLPDEQGKPVRMIGLNQDVTGQKEAEAQRARMEKEVFQSQKLESLGSLAGGIAHDMNNVLSAILGLTNFLQTRSAEDPALAKALGTVEHAALRGRDLVKGLTDFVRKDLDQPTLLDLNTLVTKESEILRMTTRQRVSLEVDLEPALGRVYGEAGTLGSALMNLCVNAIDAMPDGGVLRLKTRSLSEDQIALIVEDTGEGMSQETIDRAVEPFFTTKPVGKGTGLGLAMVHNAAKTHKGRLEIQSRLGVGTTISLILPVAHTHHSAEATPSVAHTGSRGGLRILLVDDDELIRASTPALLEQLGHVVEVAEGGISALKAIEKTGPFDLVILDHNMPGMTGIQVLEEIKSRDPNQAVMLATGFRDQAFESGLGHWPDTAVLSKPYSQREVQDRIEAIFPH
nr:ATP-binding protein [uncultured Holophaga sp.]